MSSAPHNTEVLYSNPAYNPENAFLYKAALRIATNRIVLLLSDKNDNSVQLVKQYTTNLPGLNTVDILPLNEALGAIPELQGGISHCSVLVEHPRHTLVPEALFDKEQAAALYSSCNELLPQEEVLHLRLPRLQAVMLFPFNRYLNSLLNSRLKSPTLVHISAALACTDNLSESGAEQLLLYYTEGFITLLYRQNGGIRFLNSFVAETENDALYFVLATLEEFGWKNTAPVQVCGDMREGDLMHSLLTRYIRQVQWCSTGLQLPDNPLHFPLYAASRCES